MKSLIYSTAFGEAHFHELAAEMFRSLRLRGYEGDALLLCDRDPELPASLRVKPVILPEIERYPLLKARLAELQDVTHYDRVLFVDTDVVFLRDPAPLLALAGERARVSRDHCPLARNLFNLSFLDPDSRSPARLEGLRSINSGVIVFPGARYAEYAARWIEAWNAPEIRARLKGHSQSQAELRDQPVLQRLIQQGLDCGYIPDDLILMPLFISEHARLHPDAVLLHLNGTRRDAFTKAELLRAMRAFNDAVAFEEFDALCEKLRGQRSRLSFPFPANHLHGGFP